MLCLLFDGGLFVLGSVVYSIVLYCTTCQAVKIAAGFGWLFFCFFKSV